jgi:hypothetical protein
MIMTPHSKSTYKTRTVSFRSPPFKVQKSRVRRLFWTGRIGPAFWTIASLISLVVNLILILILVVVGFQLFSIKNLVTHQVIGGLHENFVKMDEAHIVTNITVRDTIQVVDTIPVVFDLPLKQDTQVVLTENTPIKNAHIWLNGARVPLDIVLPKGTELNIHLDIVVPVNQTVPVVLTVPVELQVPVDIALNQTDLHEPFVGLQEVVAPYYGMLTSLPNSWTELPLCDKQSGRVCEWLGKQEIPLWRK